MDDFGQPFVRSTLHFTEFEFFYPHAQRAAVDRPSTRRSSEQSHTDLLADFSLLHWLNRTKAFDLGSLIPSPARQRPLHSIFQVNAFSENTLCHLYN